MVGQSLVNWYYHQEDLPEQTGVLHKVFYQHTRNSLSGNLTIERYNVTMFYSWNELQKIGRTELVPAQKNKFDAKYGQGKFKQLVQFKEIRIWTNMSEVLNPLAPVQIW